QKAPTSPAPPHLARLGITARETEILRLVNAGLSNADISHRLFISTRTVESHVSSMLQKTGLATREQLPCASTADDCTGQSLPRTSRNVVAGGRLRPSRPAPGRSAGRRRSSPHPAWRS